uniref:Uncharacterized protein n=1 Tax=Eutreptiella gymnastica TaxID=73025 RepID=A0A7S4GEN3_9EUGL
MWEAPFGFHMDISHRGATTQSILLKEGYPSYDRRDPAPGPMSLRVYIVERKPTDQMIWKDLQPQPLLELNGMSHDGSSGGMLHNWQAEQHVHRPNPRAIPPTLFKL